ncbi:MAG: tyrosine decarboxylase MfnA [Candidatus Heimdallarchaeota archaeon]|nr:tyrosine decarboxylase MfnA [Candidatus Heimdallarchaeota archaeon]
MKPSTEDIISKIKQDLADDCSYYSGRIFSSMSTFPDIDSKDIFIEFLEKNAGDPTIFSGTRKIEHEVINILGNFFHNNTPYGNSVSGGSEANIVGLWAARNYMRKRKKLNNKPLNILVPETRHTSIDKAIDLLDVKAIIIPTNEDFEINIDQVEEKIDENTISIVGVAGNTVYGAIDNIEKLSEIALNNDIWLHVDAAFGGFVIPFIENAPKFDFILQGVKSLAVDGHKMLTSPIPNGNIIFKSRAITDNIIHHLPYFSGEKTESRTLVGTKSGASIIAEYYLLKWKGEDWLKEKVTTALQNASYLKNELSKRDFTILGKAKLNVFAVIPPEKMINHFTDLHKKGWRISRYRKLWRFVVMPTLEKENIDELLNTIDSLG